jgi:acetyl coenzyme A synthetase (ADP forming)-like protein
MSASQPLSSADVLLRDGSTVHLRAVAPTDAATLLTFFAGLSDDSAYARFFQITHQNAAEVQRLTEASTNVVGVLAEVTGRPVAVASYLQSSRHPDRAEAAFAVADAFQGRGLGTTLLERLAVHARARGVATFDAYVLLSNDRMMRVFVDSGFAIERHLDGGVAHVVLSLAPSAAQARRAADRSEEAATASLRPFFAPRTVAVIGANRTRGKIGAEVLHNLKAGYQGRLVAIHPGAATIDDVPAYATVADVPGEIDLAVVSVPAAAVPGIVEACAEKGVKALVIISAGFSETGAEGRAAEAAIVDTVRRAGIRLIGPNCMGILNTDPTVRLNATFSPVEPPAGRVAMSTQSGALGLAILAYARRLHIGLSTFVSVGNKADVSSNDLIQYWSRDERTDVILLYVESFGNPRAFGRIARRVGRRKPIVAVKSGRSAAGARAATSHTGALASSDVIVDALFRQAGVIRTTTLEELFDVAMLLANQPLPQGRRVAILTNAGGPGILAADACEAQGLTLPPLSAEAVRQLRSFLPAAAAVANPVDMIASASADQYERALDVVLHDGTVDSALVIFIPPLVTKTEDVAAAVQRASARAPGKPVLGIFMSADGAPPGLAPIPCYSFPESAAVALARAAAYGEWRRQPETAPLPDVELDTAAARQIIDASMARGGGWLTPDEARALLTAAGIAQPASALAATVTEAIAHADRIGYPVALKAVGPTILHKTELGGLMLQITDASALTEAWQTLTGRLGAQMTAGLVQEMVAGGVEMLIGCVVDPTFGPVVACATGGTLAELTADSQFRLHPLTVDDARSAVDQLRGAALLRGFRGRPRLDEGALQEALLRLSGLLTACPEIQEADINPIIVLPRGARAVDVRIRVERLAPPSVSRRVAY